MLNKEIFHLSNLKTTPYPERIIQFGDTPLLRGVVNYFIDQLNDCRDLKLGISVVSLYEGITHRIPYNKPQPYTVMVKQESVVMQHPIKSVIRWLSALDDFHSVLQVAHNAELRYVFVSESSSGVVSLSDESSFSEMPPPTTVGKLCRFLFERFHAYSRGHLIIIPCDDLANNAGQLQAQVTECASAWHLDGNFIHWLKKHTWCNALVDGGVWALSAQERVEQNLPLDDFSIKTEYDCFFALQGPAWLANELDLPQAHLPWVVCDNLELYRQRRKALMASTTALIMPLAYFLGHKNVYEAVSDANVYDCVFKVLMEEIGESLPLKDNELEIAITQCMERLSQPAMQNWPITLELAIENYRDHVLPYILQERFTQTNKQQPARSLLVFAVLLSSFCTINVKEKPITLTHNEHIYQLFLNLWAKNPYNHSRWYASSTKMDRLVKIIFAADRVWGEDLSTYLTHMRLTSTHMSHLETHGLPDLLCYLAELQA